MTRSQLVLKQSNGWFAAGWQFGQALEELSDPAFKLYAWVCLHADRHTGRVQSTAPELAIALRKPEHWVESAVHELVEHHVCLWRGTDLLEVADPYWPYEKQSRPPESKDYVSEVRRMLLTPACVRCSFSAADEHLAKDLARSSTSNRRAAGLGIP